MADGRVERNSVQPRGKRAALLERVQLEERLNEGLLDDIPASGVRDFEKKLLDFMDKNYQEIFIEIAEKKILSDALKETLKRAIVRFKQTF